jgi:hypothetical protein
MHYHPASVAVYLTGSKARMTTPDGKSAEAQTKAGAASWTAAGSHLPQNVGDSGLELVLVELKK